MANQPAFQAVPTPRCCAITSSSPLVICNRPATWKGNIDVGGVTPVWCDDDRPDFAVPISGVLRVRRIAIVSQVVFTSAVESDPLARAESLARLDRAVRGAGGLLSLHSITSLTGFWAAQPGPGGENGNGGGQ